MSSLLLLAATNTVTSSASTMHVANTVTGAVAEGVKWTDKGVFLATLALAVVTALLFVATYLVARRTYELGRDTLEGNRLADIHHQRTLWPFVQPATKEGERFVNVPRQLWLRNSGAGLAVDIQARIVKVDGMIATTGMIRFGPLGADMSTQADFELKETQAWEVEIEIRYLSLFGTWGSGTYRVSSPGKNGGELKYTNLTVVLPEYAETANLPPTPALKASWFSYIFRRRG